MKAYKLVRQLSDRLFYPLFINKREPLKFGEWVEAKCYPTKGFAIRTGYHCCFEPIAPHLNLTLKSGERRVWIECEVEDFETYDRPESQGGKWILARRFKAVRPLDIAGITKEYKGE